MIFLTPNEASYLYVYKCSCCLRLKLSVLHLLGEKRFAQFGRTNDHRVSVLQLRTTPIIAAVQYGGSVILTNTSQLSDDVQRVRICRFIGSLICSPTIILEPRSS